MADQHHMTSTGIRAQKFELSSMARTVLFSTLGLGLLCLLVIYFKDDQFHTRFWTSILHNSIFFTGIALFALFKYAVSVVALGGWVVTFKRIWEAYAQFLLVGLVLLLLIAGGLYLGYHHLYHWNDLAVRTTDKVIIGKSGFLNKNFFTFFTLVVMGVWIFLAKKIRSISLDEDIHGNPSFSHHIQLRKYSSIALPVIGFTSAAFIWLWIMSLDAHWYSTMFAWYSSASLFVAMMALTIGIILYMKSLGYLEEVTTEHLHDLAKFVFAFSIFWTYLWFSQYMLIWYSNVGEETIYFRQRFDHYKVLYYANLILNFALPFLLFMRNDTKRKVGTLIFVSMLVFFGHWLDFFQMTKPGPLHTAHEIMAERNSVGEVQNLDTKTMEVHQEGAKPSSEMIESATGEKSEASHEAIPASGHAATPDEHGETIHATEHEASSGYTPGFTLPGLLDIGVLLGFLAGFLLFVFKEIGKAPLQAKNDPYYAESLHHHVQ